MTWENVVETGSGKLRFRIEIEGLRYSFVTHRSLIDEAPVDNPATRIRLPGLIVDGVKIAQRADIASAKIQASSCTFRIADVDGAATAAFATRPSATTWLEGELSATETGSMTVKSTALFEPSGVLWLDTEAISYVSTLDGTQFVGLTRGVFDTRAQGHYVPDGGRLRYPSVTDRPLVLDGRRVRLYVYGAGDDGVGTGTQIWLGVVAREPTLRGPAWTLSCDPISRVLDYDLGSDLEKPLTPRGIYISGGRSAVFGFLLSADDKVAPLAGGTVAEALSVEVAGFFETQEEFVAAINDAIQDSAIAAWPTDVQAYVTDSGRYAFRFRTASSSPKAVVPWLNVPITEGEWPNGRLFIPASSLIDGGTEVHSVSASATYEVEASGGVDGHGLVPRGTFNLTSVSFTRLGAAWPPNRIYVNTTVGAGARTEAYITGLLLSGGSDRHNANDVPLEVVDTDPSAGFIALAPIALASNLYFTPASSPEIRIGRRFGFGTSLDTVLAAIVDEGDEDLNLGASPDLRADDYDASAFEALGHGALTQSRSYSMFAPCALSELVSAELQLGGFFLTFESTGKLSCARLRFASTTERGVYSITPSNLITDDGFPEYERVAVGLYSTLAVSTGYAPADDSYRGVITVRDVTATGLNPNGRTIKIEPKSGFIRREGELDGVVALADTLLGVLGSPYAYVTCAVPLTGFDAVLGDPVSITTAHLPAVDGTRGVTGLRGIVVEREIDLYAARIEMTLLVSERQVAGYAPQAKVASHTNVSGNTWDVVLRPEYFADGDNAEPHFVAGDAVEIYRWDSTTAGLIEGDVVSVTGYTVRVTFDSTWTPGSDEWILSADDATECTETQSAYCFLAGADGAIDFTAGAEPARNLA